jgi:carboxyl-terminal processing protease
MRVFFLACFLSFSFFLNAQGTYESNFNKFRQYYTLLRYHYLDSVDFNKIIESAIVKSLENLDPHSNYLPAKESKSEGERLKGNFEGIGISYNVYKDTLTVMEVIAGGPSEKIGLLPGDKLIKINDTLFAGKSNYKADDYVSRLKGPKGTVVKLTMLRDQKQYEFVITRDVIPLYSVDISTMIDEQVGYIKLNKFAATTPQEIKQALIDLNQLGMKHLILDLQNNGGGMLQAAVALCDEFLESNSLVVYTKGLHYPAQNFETSSSGLFRKGKLIVLVNENSASASEITAGAIQDWDRGLIVGRRTFGKGLVQRPFKLEDNSEIRLTTAEYFTPTGRFIQKPYHKGERSEYKTELLNRAQAGLLTKKDTIRPPDSLMKLTLKSKRKVYGGGGITPDVYVPIDTSLNSEYFGKLRRQGILDKFYNEYVDQNKSKIKSLYPEYTDFVKNFVVNDSVLSPLKIMADSAKIKPDSLNNPNAAKVMNTVIKANIGRQIYGIKCFYRVVLEIDDVFQKAMAVIRENFTKYKVRND